MVISDATQAREQENKYGYLLQPIRDMTKNWNIDIAHELEDFLEELSQIQISFDGGKTTMNFAEAAMLIQGSACVYSKKVDYLYKLNYEVMELIMNRKKSKQAGGDREANDDHDGPSIGGGEDEEFLSLDDCAEGKNTTLRVDDVTLIVTIADIPRTPKILVKVSDAEKNDFNALINRKGEVIANSSDFKMNTSIIHPSACMLLDASHIALFEMAVQHTQALAEQRNSSEEAEKVADEVQVVPDDNEQLMQPEHILAADAMEHELSHNEDDNLGSADDPLDFGPVDVDDIQLQEPETHVARMAMRERIAERPVATHLPPRDFWQTLDPHSSDSCPVKTFVRAKRSRILMKEKKSFDLPPLVDEICGEAFYSHSFKKPSNQKKVPRMIAFETLFWKHFKQRKLQMRRKAVETRRFEAAGAENDDDDDGGEIDAGGEDVLCDVHVDAGGFEDDDALAVDYDQAMGDAEFHPVNREMNFSLLGTQGPNRGDSMPQTYEDLVRAYVDSYMNSVQEYAQVTDLSKRVAEWEDKVVPQIDEEDGREPFDIHLYGSRVLEAFINKSEVKPFAQVARCTDTYQVSRLFAATLQLANQYNVEIKVEGDLDKGMDSMALKLLSTKRHHEELEDYRAPSLNR